MKTPIVNPSLSSAHQPLRVLLLEDSKLDAELAMARVESAFPGATVVHVDDGARFESAVRNQRFDIILSDIQLPSYSGYDALSLVRRLSADIPFIYLSGAIPEERVVDLIREGATDFVSKNRLQRLEVAIARALKEVRDRETLQAALEHRQRADAFVDGVLDSLRGHAVIGMDADGDIVEWNKAAVLMFGYAREEAIGLSASIIYGDNGADALAQDAQEARRYGTAVDSRVLRREDGSIFMSEGVTTALYDTAGALTGYIKLVRDTTSRHEAAAALRAAKEEAERANRAKDRFLAVLSHELRAPLAPIATAASVLEGSKDLPPRQLALISMIQRNVALEARLIDDLFDLSAISSGKMPLAEQVVDMLTLASSTIDMVRAMAEERSIRLDLDWHASHRHVFGDPARLQQILWNLLRNAVKFSHEGGRIVLGAANEGPALVVICQDEGVGIPAPALNVIFDPFSQADENVARRYGGLGLGLSVAKSLAELHGGTLAARSEGVNKGATFSLTLPFVHPRTTAPLPAETALQMGGRNLSVLLVEDDVDAADAMVMALELKGVSVHKAASLKDAARVLQDGPTFDAVLTDLGLPDGSGLQVPQLITKPMPVIALSGFGGPDAEERSRAAGFHAHLVKPASADAVAAALRAALSAHA